jgi:hypothetical protein
MFTLLEPNSDHDNENILIRMNNCFNHFIRVFNLISESTLSPEYKFLIKEKFFGREIKNILSVSDFLRTERHESAEAWMLRLAMAGFEPSGGVKPVVNLPGYCDYKTDRGIVELCYNSYPLVCVFAYQTNIM